MEIHNKRHAAFRKIAQDEASCEGFVKYRPITRGPALNGLIVLSVALVIPFYLAWKQIEKLLTGKS